MTKYAVLLGMAMLAVLVVYLILVPLKIKFWIKFVSLILAGSAALLFYFSARDIIGRADPFPESGDYSVRFAELHQASGKIFVYVNGKTTDTAFTPRLFVFDSKTFQKHYGKNGLSEILSLARKGGQIKLKVERRAWYGGEDNADLTIDDPFGDSLPPKNESLEE